MPAPVPALPLGNEIICESPVLADHVHPLVPAMAAERVSPPAAICAIVTGVTENEQAPTVRLTAIPAGLLLAPLAEIETVAE